MIIPSWNESETIILSKADKATRDERARATDKEGHIVRLNIDGYVVPTIAHLAFLSHILDDHNKQVNRLEAAVKWLTAAFAVDMLITVLLAVLV